MTAIILVTAAVLGSAIPVSTGPGADIQAYDTGPRDGPAVVLVPGLTGCAYGFRHVADALERSGCRVVNIEPLGVGASARPADADYSLTAQAGRLATAMDALATGPAVVVAHGVAGSMALRLACRRPDLVRAVVSIEGGPDESVLTPTVERTLGLISLASRLGAKRLIRDRFADSLAAASGDRAWLDGITVRRYFQGFGRDVDASVDALRAMADAVEPEPLRPNLPRIACPVVLMLGAAPHEGRPQPDAVALMTQALPDCRVAEIAGAGHFIFEEQPDAVTGAVLPLARPADGPAAQAAQAVVAAADKGGASCAP